TVPQQPANNQWFFLLVGLAIGLSVGGVAYLSKTQSEPAAPAQVENTAPAEQPNKDKADEDSSPSFDFYAVLPEMDVVLPKEEHTAKRCPNPQQAAPQNPDITGKKAPKTQQNAAKARHAPAANDGVRYQLQAGSLRSNTDADRRRAEQVLHGFEANIQPVEL